jgi:hypothetical protein
MSEQKRRDFLKTTTAALVAPAILREFAFAADQTGAQQTQQRNEPVATDIPTVESLRTVTMPHRFGDLFNPP